MAALVTVHESESLGIKSKKPWARATWGTRTHVSLASSPKAQREHTVCNHSRVATTFLGFAVHIFVFLTLLLFLVCTGSTILHCS